MTLLTPGIDLNVTMVKPTTQKGQRIINAYFMAKYDDIRKAYGKPSVFKIKAFEEIKQEMKDAGGENLKMTGAGSDYFSCAYKVWDIDGNPYIIYHTHVNRFAVSLK